MSDESLKWKQVPANSEFFKQFCQKNNYFNNLTNNKVNAIEKHSSNLGQNVILNFGPQHPAAHGVLRLILELDGEVRIKQKF